MARFRFCLGVAATLLVVLSACAPDDAAPEVAPPAEEPTAKTSGDSSGTDGAPDEGGGAGNGGSVDGGSTSGGSTGGGTAGQGGRGETETAGQLGPSGDVSADSGPALRTARPPVGGSADLAPDQQAHPNVQCADVNWRGSGDQGVDIPPEIRVAVTGVVFEPAAFTLASGGCEDVTTLPPCLGFEFDAGSFSCSVAVAPLPDASGRDGPYYLSLVGKVHCGAVDERRCVDFAEAVAPARKDMRIELRTPQSAGLTDTENSDLAEGGAGKGQGETTGENPGGTGVGPDSGGTDVGSGGTDNEAETDGGNGGHPPTAGSDEQAGPE